MTSYRGIGFLTDYGLDDAFVAACHGAMLAVAPRSRVVDITHLVPPQDVRHGATILAAAAPYLDPMVLVAVVDPGVGSNRRPVAVAAGRSVLVGPDNGLLLPAAEVLGGAGAAVVLDRPELFRHPVSATFHGRDIFCPVAARLLTGLPLGDAGSPVDPDDLERLPEPVRRWSDGVLEAEVVHVDRYGNVALHAGAADADSLGLAAGHRADVSGVSVTVGTHFAAVAPGALVLLVDSDGRLAVAANGGRADNVLGVRRGAVLRIANPADRPISKGAGDPDDLAPQHDLA